ncbi:MAG TPA: hypothetical protein VMU19_12295 [Bryobacteraceae bacterium]|nr:hypothetical protein [Bryobacteraceae bacterium]
MRPVLTCFLFAANIWALGGPRYVATSPRPGAFALVANGSAANVRVDPADWPGVVRAAEGHVARNEVNRAAGLR